MNTIIIYLLICLIHLDDKFVAKVKFIQAYINREGQGNIKKNDPGGIFVCSLRISLNIFLGKTVKPANYEGLVMNSDRYLLVKSWIDNSKYLFNINNH